MDNSVIELGRGIKNIEFANGVGFYYSEKLEEMETKWKNNNIGRINNSCYASYFYTIPKGNRKLYFLFPYLPAFSLDIISDFNFKFKNIQFDVLRNKEMHLVNTGESSPYYSMGGINYIRCWKKKTTFKVICPLLTINYSDDYETSSVYLLNYILPIYLRIISYPEMYIDIQDQPDIPNLMAWVLSVNNTYKGYRSLSEKDLTEEQFLKIDDIKSVNNNIKKLAPQTYGRIRQTAIIEYMTK